MGSGTLFVCATPIGNLKDITLRCLETLKKVDLIAAEDTRVTLKLLSHYGIRKPLISFHKYSKKSRADYLIRQLQQGKDVALVTSAGTPAVSDPGALLVRRALKSSIPVCPIPGPSALTAAVSVSGMDGQRFLFLGFLPKKKGERRSLLKQIQDLPFTIVLYVSPHRFGQMIDELREILGNRDVTVCHELTKWHEKVDHTNLNDLAQRWSDADPKGEITLVIGQKRSDEIP
ncbi:MAG: 16S rRNA (cytidine(1402)-2'-O)-methyltransferase [Armatimonadetes bacterium]|nr:16S rRNA (cytidine(1402)-2'-O)-methyltransferase [Armatimonadota bacterium]MDW8122147.1 16S rRNA (cytidine(1402)-2'-O)-methyltransferase [Armatimonadota bacterium]